MNDSHAKATREAWRRAMASYTKSLSKKDVAEIQRSTSPQDIVSYIAEVQAKQSSSRYTKFLESVRACTGRLQRFGGAIDMLAQGSPQPGSLIWGSIKFALVIIHDHASEFERLLNALVRMSDCLPRTELYTETFSSSLVVRDCVVAYYIAILQFWERAVKFYKRRRLWNFIRSTWDSYDTEFESFVAEIQRLQDGVERSALAEHIQQSKAARYEQAIVNKALIASTTMVSQHKDIVRWLASVEYDADYYIEDLEDARKLRHSGTCEWVLENQEFKRWSCSGGGSRDSLLWIYAIPGAGKTVLSGFLVDHLTARSTCVLYFLFKNADADKNNPTAAARSLVYQIYRQQGHVNPEMARDLQLHVENSGQIRAKSFKTLWDLISKYISGIQGVTIVIDALDECNAPKYLIKGLSKLARENPVKVIVTSRHELELAVVLSGEPCLEMGFSEVQEDINAFLEYKVSRSPKLSHPLVREPVVRMLRMRNGGMFLWVSLMIKELKSKASVQEIREALQSLPDGLDKVYERILQRLDDTLNPSPKKFCQKVLKWVVCATRALRVTEIREALRMEYMADTESVSSTDGFLYSEKDIELSCGSLVTIRSGTIQLIHLSTKEYLQKPPELSDLNQGLRKYLVDIPAVSPQLAISCLSYLSSRCSVEDMRPVGSMREPRCGIQELKRCYPLLEYASFNWLIHLSESNPESITQLSSLHAFLRSQNRLVWIHICFLLDSDSRSRLQISTQMVIDRLTLILEDSNEMGILGTEDAESIRAWAMGLLTLLSEYGSVLELYPQELYFIDPQQIGGPLRTTSNAWATLPPLPYDRHDILGSIGVSGHQYQPENQKLQSNTGYTDALGIFLYEPKRDVFIYADDVNVLGKAPRVYCQERSTGRKVSPLVDVELGGEECVRVLGAAICRDGKHLGVVYVSDAASVGSTVTFYTSVWAINARLDFQNRKGAPAWATKAIFASITDGPNFSYSRPILFERGLLYCPSGKINLVSGDTEELPGVLSQDNIQSLIFYDGGHLIVHTSSGTAQRYSFDGEPEGCFQPPKQGMMIAAVDTSGRFLAWMSPPTTRPPRVIFQDTTKDEAVELQGPPGIGIPKLGFMGDLLFGAFPHRNQTTIYAWEAPSKKLHALDASIPFRTLAMWPHEDEREIYVVTHGRCWRKLNINTGAWDTYTEATVKGEDKLANENQFGTFQHWVSQDCSQLTALRLDLGSSTLQTLRIDTSYNPARSVTLALPFSGPINHRSSKAMSSLDLELIFIGRSIFHICPTYNDKILTPLAVLPISYLLDSERAESDTCLSEHRETVAFSACNRYAAMTRSMAVHFKRVASEDGGPFCMVFSIDVAGKSVAEIEIPGLRKDCERVDLHFHPSQPILALTYWTKLSPPATQSGEINTQYDVECFLFDIPSNTMEGLAQPRDHPRCRFALGDLPHEAFARFSECGTYLYLSTSTRAYFWDIPGKYNCADGLAGSFQYPRLIKSDAELPAGQEQSWNKLFFCLTVGPGGSLDLRITRRDPDVKWLRSHQVRLTIIPSYLRTAKATLLLGGGDRDHPTMRVLFFREGQNSPEMKYLPMTWKEFIPRIDLGLLQDDGTVLGDPVPGIAGLGVDGDNA